MKKAPRVIKRHCCIQGESPDKKVRTFLKVEVAQAIIFLAFKKINTGRKVAQTSIILTFYKKVKGRRCLK